MQNYFNPYMNIATMKELKFRKEISDISLEMYLANTINNFYDARRFVEEIINKYELEFYIYNYFNPIYNWPEANRLLYIKEFLFSVGYKKTIEHEHDR